MNLKIFIVCGISCKLKFTATFFLKNKPANIFVTESNVQMRFVTTFFLKKKHIYTPRDINVCQFKWFDTCPC